LHGLLFVMFYFCYHVYFVIMFIFFQLYFSITYTLYLITVRVGYQLNLRLNVENIFRNRLLANFNYMFI